jgi:hypothetical protein
MAEEFRTDAEQANPDRGIFDGPVESGADSATADDADLGHVRMRAFEDTHFGKDAVRINGHIERGHGSRFNDLHPVHRREHAAIERLIEAEKKLSEAEGALSTAQTGHDEAKLAVDRAARASEARTVRAPPLASPAGNWEGPTVKEYVASGYKATTYPPPGYASRSTPEEIAAAIAEEHKADEKRAAGHRAAEEKAAKEAAGKVEA